MDSLAVNQLVVDLLIVLAAGFLSGALCKRAGVSLLVGYLVVGAVIGEGGLGLVSQQHHELEYLARTGALLLLFAVGIEFSLEELLRLSRYFFAGGAATPVMRKCSAAQTSRIAGSPSFACRMMRWQDKS